MIAKKHWIVTLLCSLLTCLQLTGQRPGMQQQFELEGKVVAGEAEVPLPGVSVSTDQGVQTRTDALGQFRIRAASGDLLTVRGADFETVRYRILDAEDIKIVVEAPGLQAARQATEDLTAIGARHRQLLDSAALYKRGDIRKSLGFVTQSIEILDDRSSPRLLARSLAALGQIYQFHGQYDLAIANFKEALDTFESTQTLLLLGRAYVLNASYEAAESLLRDQTDRTGLPPFQRVELYEILGDANRGLGEVNRAVSFYEQAITVADKNQLATKIPDLNSKIAAAYDAADRPTEAEAYYGNSLRQAEAQNPVRAVQEGEKMADFFSKRNRFPEEIALRKQNLEKLKALGAPVSMPETDTITPQKVNYKIGRAYIAQSQYNNAIPYLTESIEEADAKGDLAVQKDATRKLSELYRDRGNYKKALDLYQEYVALVDTLYVRKEQELAQAARFNQEMAAIQNRIKSLEQDRQLSRSKYDLALAEQRLTREINNRQKYIIYSLVVGLFLTALAAFFYYRSNRQKELANHLLALKGLRSEMNPHFIFNALNSVNSYISSKDERSANRYLSDFSRLMRTVLENSEKDFIPLTEELELLEVYLKLEHARFPDKFDFAIDIDPDVDLEAYQIPPMLLQPYLENAVWHGLRYKSEKGNLRLEVRQLLPEVLQIAITDDGIGRRKSAEVKTRNQKRQKSRGMGNIARRIEILNKMYGDRITVSVQDLNPDGSGTRVVLNLRSTKPWN